MSQGPHTVRHHTTTTLWYHTDVTRTSHCEASHHHNTVISHWCHNDLTLWDITPPQHCDITLMSRELTKDIIRIGQEHLFDSTRVWTHTVQITWPTKTRDCLGSNPRPATGKHVSHLFDDYIRQMLCLLLFWLDLLIKRGKVEPYKFGHPHSTAWCLIQEQWNTRLGGDSINLFDDFCEWLLFPEDRLDRSWVVNHMGLNPVWVKPMTYKLLLVASWPGGWHY